MITINLNNVNSSKTRLLLGGGGGGFLQMRKLLNGRVNLYIVWKICDVVKEDVRNYVLII